MNDTPLENHLTPPSQSSSFNLYCWKPKKEHILKLSEFERVFKNTHTSLMKVDELHHLGFPLLLRKEPTNKSLLENILTHPCTL